MFEDLEVTPPDPILGLSQRFAADPNPKKVGLTVGVFQDSTGATPILETVTLAEGRILAEETTKTYTAQAGDATYLEGMRSLLLGRELGPATADRVRLIQTPGGCGAVRIGAELAQLATRGRIWVSSPTWANHYPLLQAAGLTVFAYPYYNTATSEIDFADLLISLGRAEPQDLVLLHAGCHNPTGADLTREQWDQVLALCLERQLVPFIDCAYLGFAAGLEQDAYPIRAAIERLPSVIVAASCSKNFGLYRERTGALLMAMSDSATATAAQSQALSLARRSYTMAPFHGARIAGLILESATLREQWEAEVDAMRTHLEAMRRRLTEELAARQAPKDFSFITGQFGMFSMLGLSAEQMQRLRDEHAVYGLDSSRINVAGLSEASVGYVAEAIVKVLHA